MDDPALVLDAESNLGAALQVWCENAEGGAIDADADCLITRSAAPLRSFNNVLVRSDVADMAALAARIGAMFAGSHGRYRLRVRGGVQPTADAAFEVHGLVRRGGIPCLGIALEHYKGAVDATGCEIRRVEDASTLQDHVAAVAAAFDWAPAELARVFRSGLVQDARWRGYVGYVNGVPVASAQIVATDGMAGVYYVGVAPGVRRGGVGESVTRHALRDAIAMGCTRAALQASPMGFRIYERMGFRHIADYRQYVPAG